VKTRLEQIFASHAKPAHHFEFAPLIRNGLRGERIDPFGWLEDEESSETSGFLEAENSYFAEITGDLSELTSEIFDEFKLRIKQTDLSVPVKKGPYEYYGRTQENKQYEILCRKKIGTDAEEILLDENQLAEGHEYFAIGSSAISPDHRMLAYIVDTDGSERHTLFVLDTMTMSLLDDVIEDLYYGLVWSNDSKTLFYTRPDKAMRPSKVYTHTLGSDPRNDQLVMEEQDDRFFLDISKTKDDAYVTIDSSSKTSTESYLIDANSINTSPVSFRPRSDGLEY
jgi:oligopeptidase B